MKNPILPVSFVNVVSVVDPITDVDSWPIAITSMSMFLLPRTVSVSLLLMNTVVL